MRWCSLARTLVDAYHRVMGEPVDFWPAYEDEVRKAVSADELREQVDVEKRAEAWAQYRREHPADAPSDRTRPVRDPGAGLQRTVTYVGRITPAEDPAAASAAAPRGVSASRRAP